jgi:hypothetical protein
MKMKKQQNHLECGHSRQQPKSVLEMVIVNIHYQINKQWNASIFDEVRGIDRQFLSELLFWPLS